jgi:hypothetical protein
MGRARRVLEEQSRFRTGWDFFIVILVVVTGLAVPFQLAFVREVDLAGSALIYLLDLVFLVDINLNLTGPCGMPSSWPSSRRCTFLVATLYARVRWGTECTS